MLDESDSAGRGVIFGDELGLDFKPYKASGKPRKKLGVCVLSQMAMMGTPVVWVSQWDERDTFSGGVNLSLFERNAGKMTFDGETIRASRRAIEALNAKAAAYRTEMAL